MRLELANKVHREMWYFDKKTAQIWPVTAVAESKTGDTIETSYGERLRTSTKHHAVFNNWDFARIAQKMEKNEIDSEYDEILSRNNLRRVAVNS